MTEEDRQKRSKYVKQVIASEGNLYRLTPRLRALMQKYIDGEITIDAIYKELRKDAQ